MILPGGYDNQTAPLARSFISYPFRDEFYDQLGLNPTGDGTCTFFGILNHSWSSSFEYGDILFSNFGGGTWFATYDGGWNTSSNFVDLPTGIGFMLQSANAGTISWNLPEICIPLEEE